MPNSEINSLKVKHAFANNLPVGGSSLTTPSAPSTENNPGFGYLEWKMIELQVTFRKFMPITLHKTWYENLWQHGLACKN